MNKLCVISMSGGLDSSTLAYKALSEGYSIIPINIDYGQTNVIERKAFTNILKEMQTKYGVRILDVVDIDLTQVLKSSLEMYQSIRDSGLVEEKTELEFYTPSRNLLFSTLATTIGEIAAIAAGVTEVRVGLGVHKHTEYKNYWDISPEFVKRLNHLLELNDCMSVKMYAPYADSTKDEIVRDALKLGVPIHSTWTCYEPVKDDNVYKPCLKCEACIERQKAGDLADYPNVNDYSVTAE